MERNGHESSCFNVVLYYFLTTYTEEGLVGKSVSLLPHHLYRRGARGEVGVCRVYFLTTYREEWLVGKLVCLYFLTTYGE